MTKIQFDDNLILQAGIFQVQKRNLRRALALFCQVNNYEGQLNQLACLCCLGEHFYAVELYRQIISLYVQTHNVMTDVASLGSGTANLLQIIDQDFSTGIIYDQTKLSADKSLLANYANFSTSILDIFSPFDENATADLLHQPKFKTPTQFFDVKSQGYAYQLRDAIYDAHANGDVEMVKKYAKQLFQIDSNDEEILETQIALCVFFEKYSQGCIFAQKLAHLPDVSPEGICGALDVLSHKGSQHKDTIYLFLQRAKEVDIAETTDLCDFVRLATNVCADYGLAMHFAKKLHSNPSKDVECAKICAYAFYNVGEIELLKQNLSFVRNCLPFDTFARFTFHYIATVEKRAKFFKIPDRIGLHLQLPKQYVTLARDYFMNLKSQDLTLDCDKEYLYLCALIDQSKFYGMFDKFDEYAKCASAFRVVAEYYQPANRQKDVEFFCMQLSKMYPEPSLVAVFDGILARLIKQGCRQKVLLRLRDNKSHRLDLSKIKLKEEIFVNALCVCATMHNVNVSKMQKAFEFIQSAQVDLANNMADVRKVAYCLLRLTCPKMQIPKHLQEFFVQEDQELFYILDIPQQLD